MKKTLLLAAVLFVAASCQKENATNEMQTIRIGFNGVQSGAITKVEQSVNDIILGFLPTSGVTLTLSPMEEPTKGYNAEIGKEVTLPVGEYKVVAHFTPQEVALTYKNGKVFRLPKFSIYSNIVVESGKTDYKVSAQYECWALVIDYTACSKYQHKNYQYNMEDFSYFTSVGNYGIAFITGEWINEAYTITAVPKDAAKFQEKQYKVYSVAGKGGVCVENGYWYTFAAGEAITEKTPIVIEYGSWAQGTTEE